MIDLWSDEEERIEEEVEAPSPQEEEAPPPPSYLLPPEGKHLRVSVDDDRITIVSRKDLRDDPYWKNLMAPQVQVLPEGYLIQMALRPMNAFVLRYLLKAYRVVVEEGAGQRLAEAADRVPRPKVTLAEGGRHLEVTAPGVDIYQHIVRALNGYPVQGGVYRIQMARLLDLQAFANALPKQWPAFEFHEEVVALTTSPIPGFDGTMESLKTISVGELNVVKANSQSYKAKKKSDKTLAEKMTAFGVASLFDLLHWLPRRYIDKSKPQDLRDLVIDEAATIVGKVDGCSELPNNMGVVFTIVTDGGGSIRVTFWRQHWLKGKFPTGSEVLITGKFGFYGNRPQLTGTSIEHAQEAALLPIVPVYKQSEGKGITTALLLASVRELFARLDDIKLPAYLYREDRPSYYEVYKELHLPTTLEHNTSIMNSLAYYELVLMQLLIQEQKEISRKRPGIPQPKTSYNLQEKAIELLPFTLTGAQERAVAKLNENLADVVPSSTLLNADVGAGKTLVAQLACLRSVEAGYQAVLLAPTDVLATQLHSTFQRLLTPLAEAGFQVELEYLSGSVKGPEKKRILKGIKEGTVDVVVGTHAAFAASVEYSNLGFVVIDEQQKFGAEQRSTLLAMRKDGRIPDMLMQSATPIPRSVAQVFYGDIDMILMDEKPPGRIPITTEWIEEDPLAVIEQPLNPMWGDVIREAEAGNQTFVITPMVRDSSTVDAASVERTYEMLKKRVFPNLRVAYVHGQMKQDLLGETMKDFRDKKYDVLVASTVVEVGVDIPDATRVVILSADRMGASSLHQIRGRVGRNSKPSTCYLVSLGRTENSRTRLQSLVDSENGFEVAKADLKVRGEGTVFGGSQSGASEMTFATLARHGALVPKAMEEARSILASPHREEALRDSQEFFSREKRLV